MPPHSNLPSMDDLWAQSDERHSFLTPLETFWLKLQPFLASNGYALRRRWQPDWVPSWRESKLLPIDCEDSAFSKPTLLHTMDAWSIKHDRRVMLKQVKRDAYGDNEIRIMSHLSQDGLSADPRNHSIPLLDVLDPGSSFTFVLIVMPLLLDLRHVDFLTVGDAMEFCHQVLEGLVFMHEHNVAHRDCCVNNIMVEGEAMYSKGRHPKKRMQMPGIDGKRTLRISDISPKYYFIDFGHSDLFNSFEERAPVLGRRGQYKQAPELQTDLPVDGFKLDVWCVGYTFQWLFVTEYRHVDEILGSLLRRMLQELPDDRPTAAEALQELEKIRLSLGPRLKQRIPQIGDSPANILSFYYGNVARMLWLNAKKQATLYKRTLPIPYALYSVHCKASPIQDS